MARKQGSHAGITGPRVRSSALTLFARHGYAAVSMRQIAADVGVQAGALYTYTPDKQALLFDLMRSHMEHLLASWQADPKPQAPAARLEHFTRFHLRYHLDRPDEVFIAYMELRNLAPDNHRTILALRRQYEDALTGILRAGVLAGTFSVPDCKVTTMALIAMLTGVTTWFRDGGRLNRTDLEESYWALVAQSVGLTQLEPSSTEVECRRNGADSRKKA